MATRHLRVELTNSSIDSHIAELLVHVVSVRAALVPSLFIRGCLQAATGLGLSVRWSEINVENK